MTKAFRPPVSKEQPARSGRSKQAVKCALSVVARSMMLDDLLSFFRRRRQQIPAPRFPPC